MTASLVSAIKRFCNHSKRLQTILEETKRCFDDINERATTENGQQVFSVELLQEEESEVLCTAQKQPGIVIFGQNAYCKSKVVNEIFNRTIFPTFDNTDDKTKYRMVRFKHGDNLSVSLALPGDYALVENLEGHNGPWNTIPRKDLEFHEDENSDAAHGAAVLEVSVNLQLLRYGCVVVVSECNSTDPGQFARCIENISPILVYAFQTESLTTKEIQELEELKQLTHFQPICFLKVPNPWPPDSQIQMVAGGPFHCSPVSTPKSPILENSAEAFDYMLQSSSPNTVNIDINQLRLDSVHSDIRGHDNAQQTVTLRQSLQPDVTPSSPSHRQGRVFVSSIPPTDCTMIFKQLCGIGYLTDTPGVRNISREIVGDYFEVDSVLILSFDQFMSSFTTFLEQTLQRYLVNSVTVLNNTHIRCLNTFIISAFDMARDMLITPKKLEFAREREEELYKSLLQIAVDKGDEIKDMIGQTIAANWDKLVEKANEYDFIGVDFGEKGEILTPKGLKICTGQIQELVLGGLNQAVAGKLVSSVDILRDSYTGTLTRCLESLEKVERENPATTQALKQIVQMTYRLEISLNTSSAQVFRRKMQKLVQAMPWSNPPRIDDEWKKKVAAEMLTSLSAGRLAKSISSQIKDRLNKSHEAFLSALKQLETKHCGRLDKIEEDRLKLRKYHAPRVAKLALESTSLKDHILYGTPVMGKEIGRGQYGVVYSCDTWAGTSPCAVKSVVPPDDKHWNDLALEFFYTKNIPEHDRIVALRGSVIDYSYGGGTTPAVLLVMDRLQRDLYTAIKQQLDWVGRLQVSIDVVEGIRFLHSQGLVHRDIKLKNVLLDDNNRGKITDLGFCKPEAMMSGSIVGTPIHMAPELFTGRYDSSVDVYAFGILFWYVCAGNVRLPTNFEQCANKDQLWNNVKKGLRPEQLPVFDDDCWNLMEECWESEPSKRPLLGEVQHKLSQIYDKYKSSRGLRTAKEGPSYKSGKPLKYKIK